MRRPSLHLSKATALLAAPIAIVAAGALIFAASHAAFSSTTRNSGNSWSTGSVALTNDSAGSARFVVTKMVPGASETKCITVTANATVPGVVKGYVINPVTSPQGLENHIFVTAVEGEGGSFGSCDGFAAIETEFTHLSLADLALHNSYANGIGEWDVTGNVPGGESRTYEITWTFDTTGLTQGQLDALQGATTGLDFQWELQST